MTLAALFDLRGRRALVTGGNSGIGEAMARALGLAGARVLLVARREAELARTAQRLNADAIETSWLVADLTDIDAMRMAAQTAEQRLGGIDILINAACPGLVDTDASRPWFDDMSKALTPDAAATDVAWLATLPPGTQAPYGELVRYRGALPWQ